MRISKILIITGICVAFAGAASAATKCVNLTSSTTCSYVNPGTYVVDWGSNCTSSGTSVVIRGVSQCSSTAGSSIGQTATSLEISGDTDDMYCWCKMVSPAVSSWVFYDDANSASLCASSCAERCAYYAAIYSAFRSALLSELSD